LSWNVGAIKKPFRNEYARFLLTLRLSKISLQRALHDHGFCSRARPEEGWNRSPDASGLGFQPTDNAAFGQKAGSAKPSYKPLKSAIEDGFFSLKQQTIEIKIQYI